MTGLDPKIIEQDFVLQKLTAATEENTKVIKELHEFLVGTATREGFITKTKRIEEDLADLKAIRTTWNRRFWYVISTTVTAIITAIAGKMAGFWNL